MTNSISQTDPLVEKNPSEEELEQLPFTTHLIVLRKCLIKCVGLILLLFFIMLPFANQLYEMLSSPLRRHLPEHATMIATDVTATFMAPFKLNFYMALIISMPFILYQIWHFLAPALYKTEKKIALPILLSSIVLFYAGIAFAYFVTLPAVLGFFMQASPDSVAPMTDINSYLNFCLKLFLVFGITFEIPVATLMLILGGFVTIESLAAKRRYIIVGCFFVAMFVTPPDALSMLMLAVPMWLLFELGVILGRILIRQQQQTT